MVTICTAVVQICVRFCEIPSIYTVSVTGVIKWSDAMQCLFSYYVLVEKAPERLIWICGIHFTYC